MTLDEATTTIHLAKIGTEVSPETWLRVAETLLVLLDSVEAERDALQVELGHVSAHGVQLAADLETVKAEAAHLAANQLADGAERNLASDVDTMRERAESAEREVNDVLRVLHGKDEFPLLSTAMVARQVLAELKARAEKAEKTCAAMRTALNGLVGYRNGAQLQVWDTAEELLADDDAGREYVHREALWRVAELVHEEAAGQCYAKCTTGCEKNIKEIDLAELVKEVAP